MKGNSLRNATTMKRLCALRRDNFEVGDKWLIADETTVTVADQSLGEPARALITFTRREFNRLIDAYQRVQASRRSK